MGITKTEVFKEKENKIAKLLKAVGHPARVAIIDYLLKVDSCICKDIVNELPLSQPTISQHLKELKTVGLIQGTIEGNSVCYCLNFNEFELLHVYFSEISQNLENKRNNCC